MHYQVLLIATTARNLQDLGEGEGRKHQMVGIIIARGKKILALSAHCFRNKSKAFKTRKSIE
jgi:hypothetical protein